jgi:hypothetical protein
MLIGSTSIKPLSMQNGGSASAGCSADVYRSAGSARLAVEAQLARR